MMNVDWKEKILEWFKRRGKKPSSTSDKKLKKKRKSNGKTRMKFIWIKNRLNENRTVEIKSHWGQNLDDRQFALRAT